MQGPRGDPGINARALQQLFRAAEEEPERQFSFAVAAIEVCMPAVPQLRQECLADGEEGLVRVGLTHQCSRPLPPGSYNMRASALQ